MLEVYEGCGQPAEDRFDETFTPGARLDMTTTSTSPIYVRLLNNSEGPGGAQDSYQLQVTDRSGQDQTGAAIIVAGRLKRSDPLQSNIRRVAEAVYNLFQNHDYTDENIYVLATDSSQAGYDAAATTSNLRYAVSTWAMGRTSASRALTL